MHSAVNFPPLPYKFGKRSQNNYFADKTRASCIHILITPTINITNVDLHETDTESW